MLTRKLMAVREVADLTQVSEVTVRHWIKDGALRATDVGREFRIVPRDLEAFLDQHATSAAHVTAGQEADCSNYDALMEARDSDPAVMLVDKGYDSAPLRQDLRDRGAVPEIPTKRNRLVQHSVSRPLYAHHATRTKPASGPGESEPLLPVWRLLDAARTMLAMPPTFPGP